MDARHLELAAEFCALAGSADLFEYLGIDADTTTDGARAKLKSRRKYMQGMQGNPKYKREALFLIKHFSALNSVLGDLAAYGRDASARAESVHLPILEMTIKGVLAGGPINTDQLEFLQHQAEQLGVGTKTFDELVRRLADEAGHPLDDVAGDGPSEPVVDLYSLLGVDTSATPSEVQLAYRNALSEVDTLPPEEAAKARKKLDIARNVLSNEAARRHYDLTAARTGPPARARERRPDQAATAPPVRVRDAGPGTSSQDGQPARLEILGDPVRQLLLAGSSASAEIRIRNGGDAPMGGTVVADVDWVRIEPTVIDPTKKEQAFTLSVSADAVPETATTTIITLTTDRGERAKVVFELAKGPSMMAVVGLAVFAAILVVVAVGLALGLVG